MRPTRSSRRACPWSRQSRRTMRVPNMSNDSDRDRPHPRDALPGATLRSFGRNRTCLENDMHQWVGSTDPIRVVQGQLVKVQGSGHQ